ncbi:MAG: murein hydrolase activator EnvC family protein [Gemmatimonadales bacterium]
MTGARALAALLALALARPALAQQAPPDTAIQHSQQRLDEIRRERERLQTDMERLRGRVHSLSSELNNIEAQVQVSGRMINELDLQVTQMGVRIDSTTADLIVALDALSEKRAILKHRLTEISKRGPLYTFQVLLAAESFGDLLSRYKYLYLVSRQDRQLVTSVETLRDTVAQRRVTLLNLRSSLTNRRDERTQETERLRLLQGERQRSLRQTQAEQQHTESRLRQLAQDEARVTNLIAALERRRRAALARRAATPAPAHLRTADLGQLDWPVNGDIAYSFGRAAGPGNTTIRWNGIGITAPVGTPVHAVAAGTVRYVTQLGTYGLCVVLDHNGGYYSLYCQLQGADVREGQAIERGAVVGRTGGANSDQGPHLYFEIRGDTGQALDPVQWLRRRR